MTGELHRPRSLGEITNAGPGEGGSFSFDEATMQSLVNDWLDLANDYRGSVRAADAMIQIQPPGDEYASRGLTESANESGTSYIDYLNHNLQYCLTQAQLFQDALDDYRGVEHTNVTEIDKTGREV